MCIRDSDRTAGANSACAIVTGGSVKCWGYNAYGQLGNNSTTAALTPVAVSNLTGAQVVSTGAYHACAIVGGGAVKCWGYGGYGALGNGSTTDSHVPVS